MKFTQILDYLKYPKNHRGVLSTYHSDIINYVMSNFKNEPAYRRSIVDAVNIISYIIISGDSFPSEWTKIAPLENLPDIDSDLLKEMLADKGMYLDITKVEWDVMETIPVTPMHYSIADTSSSTPKEEIASDTSNNPPISLNNSVKNKDVSASHNSKVSEIGTPKQDLYIQNPLVPRINVDDIYASGRDGSDVFAIYQTLPIVPTRQCDISVTTDVSNFSDSDFLKLYPNRFIPTRAPEMYKEYKDLTVHKLLGTLIPVDGFSESNMIDNIVKYPHLYQLQRNVNDKFVSFYKHIEIDGELYSIADIWDTLPEAKRMPKNKEFMKEYVIRRYLLERDIAGVQHKYPIFGELNPYLTLFMTIDQYQEFGYSDTVDLARKCVLSRVSYRTSRNPVLRRLSYV